MPAARISTARIPDRHVGLSQATTLVVANAAAAYEVCKFTNPPLWLTLLAGISLARVESELIWSFLHRKPIRLTRTDGEHARATS